MIDLEILKVGDVVRLMSGSPYMTVRGFKPLTGGPPGHERRVARTHATCVVWSHRHGFLKDDFAGAELCWPAVREPREPDAGADHDGEGGA